MNRQTPIKDGFLQEPRYKDTEIGMIHLEDTLTHIPSNNVYRVKEIQNKGFLVHLINSPLVKEGLGTTRFYLSDTTLKEHKIGKLNVRD